jgi:hypothetical protein
MAKRFTDSTKWSNTFVRSLKAPYKLLWLYILDDCDHAGIWQVDIEVAEIRIGEKLNLKMAETVFKDKIAILKNGEKWFIKDFIDFQYGELNPQNRAHNSVISILNKYNLIDENLKFKDLISPLQGAMDMDKNKDMDKDKEKEKEIFEKKSKIEIEKTEKSDLEKTFDEFIRMRVKMKKSPTDYAIELLKNKLKTLSGGNEVTAIRIIQQSLVSGWTDFYDLKTNQKETLTTAKIQTTTETKEKLSMLRQMYS